MSSMEEGMVMLLPPGLPAHVNVAVEVAAGAFEGSKQASLPALSAGASLLPLPAKALRRSPPLLSGPEPTNDRDNA